MDRDQGGGKGGVCRGKFTFKGFKIDERYNLSILSVREANDLCSMDQTVTQVLYDQTYPSVACCLFYVRLCLHAPTPQGHTNNPLIS